MKAQQDRGAGRRNQWGNPVLWVVALAFALGCASSSVTRGAEFYAQGRYIDAAQVFEYDERNLPAYGPQDRARYALYRGATLRALGDHEGARQWLAYGKRLGARSFSESERVLLMQNLDAVAPSPRPGDARPTVPRDVASSAAIPAVGLPVHFVPPGAP